jgi:hypothetical protein
LLLLLFSQAAADGVIGPSAQDWVSTRHLCWLQDRNKHTVKVLSRYGKLAHRIAVVGSYLGSRGTDRQSVDAALDVVNFRRGQLACILAAQDSVIFVVSVHSLSFLSWVVVVVPLDAALRI